jgi:hypothetical protein
MAISATAIFWIDHDSGSDTARTALTSCTASNPSGTITRITKTAHGLDTGAVVDLTLYSSWLNGAYQITKVSDDAFDLDNTVWQATADADGTVTPRGGSLLSPWKTLTSGATSSRLANLTTVSYEVRHKKTADPVSLSQNVTLTNGSRTVTLVSALTLTLDNCETAWTARTNVATANSTTRKQGSQATQVTTNSSFTTGAAAYKTLAADVNLSSYTGITFWMRAGTTSITADTWQIRLYSDSGRTTLVETLSVPAIAATGVWCPIYIDKGSALASQVRVIELYANATQTSKIVLIDNFSACTSTLHLKSLVGLNDGMWMPLDWLDGTTFGISNSPGAVPTAGYGWPKATTTATCYKRECYVPTDGGTAASSTAINTPGLGGTSKTLRAKYSFGWDLSTQTRTGETWFDGLTGNGYGLSHVANGKYIDVEYFCTCRCANTFYHNGAVQDVNYSYCKSAGNTYGILATSGGTTFCVTFNSCIIFGSDRGVYLNLIGLVSFTSCEFYNPTSSCVDLSFSVSVYFKSCTFRGTPTSVIGLRASGSTDVNVVSCTFTDLGWAMYSLGNARIILLSCTFATCTNKHETSSNGQVFSINCDYDNLTNLWVSASPSDVYTGRAYTHNTDLVANDHRIYNNRGTILTDAATYHGSATYGWKMMPIVDYPQCFETYPLEFEVHRVVCVANVAQTVKAWVRRSNTGLSIGLRVKEAVLTGISATTDALCTAAADTWQEVTLTFTPTQAGVAQIWGVAWGGTTYSGYISDLTPMANQSTKLLNTAFGGQPFSSNAGETTAVASGTPAFAFLG